MLLWLIDPLSNLKLEKDSTIFLAFLAHKAGAKNLFTNEIYLENSALKCRAFELTISVNENEFPGNTVKTSSESKVISLDTVDVVMNRLEPPIDDNYLLQCKLLTLHPKVVNSPVALQAYSEKLLPLQFDKGIPSSIGLKAAPAAGIIKPMNVFGGTGVMKVAQGDQIECGNMFQPFREVIAKGEKRYFILGDKVFGEILKVPAANDFRSNSMHGSTLSYVQPDKKLLQRTQHLVPKLNAIGIRIAVVDYVGDEIIEINFTCPSLWNLLYKHLNENERKLFAETLKTIIK
jgi:glutathione synthase